jgi:hypothetical protein
MMVPPMNPKFRKHSDQTYAQKSRAEPALDLNTELNHGLMLQPPRKGTADSNNKNAMKRLSVGSGASTQLSSGTANNIYGGSALAGTHPNQNLTIITPETQTSPGEDLEHETDNISKNRISGEKGRTYTEIMLSRFYNTHISHLPDVDKIDYS